METVHVALENTKSVSNLFIPKEKTQNFQKRMAFAGSKIWNEIPKEIRMTQTVHSFKEHLKKHHGFDCCAKYIVKYIVQNTS